MCFFIWKQKRFTKIISKLFNKSLANINIFPVEKRVDGLTISDCFTPIALIDTLC